MLLVCQICQTFFLPNIPAIRYILLYFQFCKFFHFRAYFLEAVKEHIQVLSRLLVENVVHGGSNTTMATGKLLLLMATAVNDKPRKHRQSLTERINIARNLLNCYFELIKLDSKHEYNNRAMDLNLLLCVSGDSDMGHDTWLTSCSDVISSLLSQQQDGLANFLFSALLKTVLSPVSNETFY